MGSQRQGTVFGMKFPIRPDQRVRVLTIHRNKFNPIFWFGFGSDGSIYLGPGYTKLTKIQSLLKGRVQASTGVIRVNYGEGEIVTDPSVLKGIHLSFHASGQVNIAGDEHFAEPLTELQGQKWLCSMVFEHPSKWPTADFSGSNSDDKVFDIPASVMISEASPLCGSVYVAPADKLVPVIAGNMKHQTAITCICSGLKNIQDMGVHMIFGQGSVGPWPPETYFLYAIP